MARGIQEQSIFDVCLELTQAGSLEAEQLLDEMNSVDTFRIALHLHELGFSLLPIYEKRPVRKWKPLQYERIDLHTLVHWFYSQQYEPGIITGELSGIIAVDYDEGIETGDQASTVTQRTKRGVHHIFRHPGYHCGNRQRVDGRRVDVRGDGGYIKAYPDCLNWTDNSLLDAPVYNDSI